ncbi:MAG TPA: NAD(P)H-dependent glycerol-3-phosphate dehydrogenase [Polyangia bacterium]|nr:NAD(P)H-dependent glycerol-3-phosphate dehydrogenase [Polyangia bacterium]
MNDQEKVRRPVAVIGGGSMGTALAILLGENGHEVNLWVFEPDLALDIERDRENQVFLPGHPLPANVCATSSQEQALRGAEIVFSVTPAQVLRAVWREAGRFIEPGARIVCASKGVEVGTGMLMNEVLEEVVPEHPLAVLSGPSFAAEIAERQPTAVVVASMDAELAMAIQRLVSAPTFRAYTSDDVVGVELGGALKNVIAVAVGMTEGMGLGLNSRAALITRGLAEISRLAVACGANPLTLAGLAGTGDLVLTCTGHLSRNLQVGIRLGRGESLEDILGSMKMVAEGVATSRSALGLARQRKVEMPITEAVVGILDGATTPADAVRELMGRRLRSERES